MELKTAHQSFLSHSPLATAIRRRWKVSLLVGILLAAAILVRLRYSQGTNPGVQVPPLAMDDSAAELPLSPLPLPPNPVPALQVQHARVQTLSAQASVPARMQAAHAAADLGDLWLAQDLLRQVLKADPEDRLARLLLADILRRETHFDEARSIYQQMLARDSRDSDAYLGMADTCYSENRRPEAFDWLARAENQGAQTVASLSAVAHRYQDWKDFPRAGEAMSRALRIAPTDPGAQLLYASILAEGGQLVTGAQMLEQMVKQSPNNGVAQRVLGVIVMNATYPKQDLNRARMLLESAADTDPKDIALYRSLAVIYRQQHLYRLAAQAYYAQLLLDPTTADGRYGLSQVYALLGKQDLSRGQLALYSRLVARDRRNADLFENAYNQAKNPASHEAFGQFLESVDSFPDAIEQYEVAAGQAPHNRVYRAALDRLYTRLGWGELPSGVH